MFCRLRIVIPVFLCEPSLEVLFIAHPITSAARYWTFFYLPLILIVWVEWFIICDLNNNQDLGKSSQSSFNFIFIYLLNWYAKQKLVLSLNITLNIFCPDPNFIANTCVRLIILPLWKTHLSCLFSRIRIKKHHPLDWPITYVMWVCLLSLINISIQRRIRNQSNIYDVVLQFWYCKLDYPWRLKKGVHHHEMFNMLIYDYVVYQQYKLKIWVIPERSFELLQLLFPPIAIF